MGRSYSEQSLHKSEQLIKNEKIENSFMDSENDWFPIKMAIKKNYFFQGYNDLMTSPNKKDEEGL